MNKSLVVLRITIARTLNPESWKCEGEEEREGWKIKQRGQQRLWIERLFSPLITRSQDSYQWRFLFHSKCPSSIAKRRGVKRSGAIEGKKWHIASRQGRGQWENSSSREGSARPWSPHTHCSKSPPHATVICRINHILCLAHQYSQSFLRIILCDVEVLHCWKKTLKCERRHEIILRFSVLEFRDLQPLWLG